MVSDYFLGFAAHAHTKNELETDPNKETELRRRNSPEEARTLTETVLDKLEKDISNGGYDLKDVKLLILYLSYRGEPEEKDREISELILRTLETKFKKHVAADGLRLIGHTTVGELENEDLVLKDVSGIGYNGLSLMALVTNIPIGVGRTWGLRNDKEAVEQGLEMTRDAWLDFSKQSNAKQHLQRSKVLHVLAQGGKINAPGYEHFLAEGIAHFMGSTREARIMNIVGRSTADGMIGERCYQYFGRLGKAAQLKILDSEAVCALIPCLTEVSMGLDISAIRTIGRQHTFHFNRERQPHFKYVKRIGKMDPCRAYAKAIYQNEAKISAEKNLPAVDEETIYDIIIKARALPFSPIVGRYAFTFPFGNYTCATPLRLVEKDLELLRPVRSYIPQMAGYIAIGDSSKVQKGAWNVYNMLRTDQGFSSGDATIIVSCISRRLVELMDGCTSNTEAEILKEGFSSTQSIGFVGYGELAFTNLIQEPYFWNFSCWGITFRSVTDESKKRERRKELGIKGWIKGES